MSRINLVDRLIQLVQPAKFRSDGSALIHDEGMKACTLPLEMAAARAMLGEIHDTLPTPLNDHNNHVVGNTGPHNVVVACLPAGVYIDARTLPEVFQLQP
ncbi:hypothetical protein BDW71DRAFT_172763 [Aspergillus fruticulosus]